MTMKAFLAAALLASVAPLHAQAPDADAMIKNIRLSATLKEMNLNGQIRKEGGGAKIPVSLFVRENNMQFMLNNAERFHIRMGDESAQLMTVAEDRSTKAFPAAKLAAPIADTDVTYEDLTLRFLYWPNAKLEGEEKAKDGTNCYRVALTNPGKDGAFSRVYVWVHKEYGAFWQVRAYDRAGKPIKEFLVDSVMPLPGGKNYTIKQMRVNTLSDKVDKSGNPATKSITYIEFQEPEGGAKVPKGLRK